MRIGIIAHSRGAPVEGRFRFWGLYFRRSFVKVENLHVFFLFLQNTKIRMTADCARLCLWCLIAPLPPTPAPTPSCHGFVLLIFPSLTADTSPLHYCLGPARTPGESLASHRPHFKRNENTDRSVPSVFSAAPLPTHLSGSPPPPPRPCPHHIHPPPFHLPRQAKQSSAAAPTWISLSSLSGNVCWSFRVSCQTAGVVGGNGEAEIKQPESA